MTNRINHLEAQTNRLYAEVEGNKEELITVWDRLDGVEQSLEAIDVDEDAITVGGRVKSKKYLFLMPMASLGKKKFL